MGSIEDVIGRLIKGTPFDSILLEETKQLMVSSLHGFNLEGLESEMSNCQDSLLEMHSKLERIAKEIGWAKKGIEPNSNEEKRSIRESLAVAYALVGAYHANFFRDNKDALEKRLNVKTDRKELDINFFVGKECYFSSAQYSDMYKEAFRKSAVHHLDAVLGIWKISEPYDAHIGFRNARAAYTCIMLYRLTGRNDIRLLHSARHYAAIAIDLMPDVNSEADIREIKKIYSSVMKEQIPQTAIPNPPV